jgi:chaperonin GroES
MLSVLNDNLLVELHEQITKVGSVLLPEQSARNSHTGTVVSIGSGRETDSGERIPVCANVGDQVIFHEHNGKKVEIKGKKYLVLRDNQIEAVVTKTDDKSDLNPTGGRVVVSVIEEAEQKSPSGLLFIPTTVDNQTHSRGRVAAVGVPVTASGAKLESTLEEGQIVAYRKNAGLDLTIEGTEYVLINEDEIYGVFTE